MIVKISIGLKFTAGKVSLKPYIIFGGVRGTDGNALSWNTDHNVKVTSYSYSKIVTLITLLRVGFLVDVTTKRDYN